MLALVAGPPAHAQSSDTAPDIEGGAAGEKSPDGEDARGSEEPEQPEESAASLADMPWIEDVPLPERARARELFLEGTVLLEDTLFASAPAKYEEALAIWAHPSFYYNLALARIHLDQPIAAYESMQQAVRYGQAPLGEDLYKNAQSILKLLEGQLAEVEIVCDQPGAQVSLDGEPLFEGPGRHRGLVRPGGHQVVASGEGRVPVTRELVLAPGEQVRVEIAPLYLQVRETRRWRAWKPWAVLGAGVAVALAGGALQWHAGRDFRAFDTEVRELSCNDDAPAGGGLAGSGCTEDEVPPEVAAQLRRATWQKRAAIAAYTVGGAALATGAVLLVLNRARPVRTYAEQPSAWLMLAPDHIGIAAHVRF